MAVQASEQRYDFRIETDSLQQAMEEVYQQTGIQLIYPYSLAGTVGIRPVVGRYTIAQAVEAMLRGTGLSGQMTEHGVMVVSRSGASDYSGKEGHMMSAQQNQSKKKTLAYIVGFLSLGAWGGVNANAEEQDSSEGWQLEEVVVTAQKKQESIQEVPMSVSAFSGADLQQSGIENSQDLELVTPALAITNEGTLGRVTVRGVGSSLQGVGADPSVAVYIDGVYMSRFTNSLVDLVDLERVEVLKGPQVVLYGRNATAGAIHLISKGPANEFAGHVNGQLGNEGLVRFGAAMDIPLVKDSLLFRGSLMRVKDDGHTENILNPADRHDKQDTLAGRLTLKYLATEDLDITLRAAFSDEDGSRNAQKAFNPAGLGSIYDLKDPRKVAANQIFHMPVETQLLSTTIDWDLGWGQLKSITAYNESEFGPLNKDLDATENTIVHNGVVGQPDLGLFQKTETYSQEVTLTGGQEKLQWLMGVFYLQEDGSYGGANEQGPDIVYYPSEAETEAYAVYGKLSYNLTDQWRLNAGVRYSDETKTMQRTLSAPAPAPLQEDEDSWDAWTPYGGIDYFLSDDIMLYLTVSEGFKSGAFNQFDVGPAVAPEFITSYEVGAKTIWMDSRLQVNASTFYYDYTDLQVQTVRSSDLSIIYDNTGEAEITGAELNIEALPAESLRLTVGLSWLDAEYKQFDGTLGDFSGNTPPLAPEYTANAGIDYLQFLSSVGKLNWKLDYFHSSARYFRPDNAIKQSYYLVNARITYTPVEEDWDLSLFGKNLTDEDVYSSAVSVGTAQLTSINAPRVYGAELNVYF